MTLEAENFLTKTAGGYTSGGWNLWSNGYIENSVNLVTSGAYSFDVVAKGDYAGGAWPNMELRIDQAKIASAPVDSNTWKTFSLSGIIPAGIHNVAIAFTNDYYNPPEDRNLYIDNVTIDKIVDTTFPVVSLTSPLNGATISGKAVAITASASDNIGVQEITFYRDSGVVLGNDTLSPYSITWDSTTVPNGSHALFAKAKDLNGNETISTSITITVNNDLSAPSVFIISPLNNSTVPRGKTYTIVASATDNEGVTKVEFYINGALTCTDATASYTCSWKVPNVPKKTYQLQAKAYDATGNMGISAIIKVTSK